MAKIYTRQEVKRRKMKFQVFAGMFDFLGILAGIVAIVVLAALLTALVRWTIANGRESFRTLWDMFMSALIIPD